MIKVFYLLYVLAPHYGDVYRADFKGLEDCEAARAAIMETFAEIAPSKCRTKLERKPRHE